MYTSVNFSSQIVARRGVSYPTNKGVSYTNLVSGLARTLKLYYIIHNYYILLYFNFCKVFVNLYYPTTKIY
jgi:hypothetical protein